MLRRIRTFFGPKKPIIPAPRKLSLFFPLIGEALISLKGNRLRSFLAMLGIIIGVASVVLMVAIGNGSKRVIEDAINALGTNQLVVAPAEINANIQAIFTINDVNMIAQLPNVQNVAPVTLPREMDVGYGTVSKKAQVSGIVPEYVRIRNWDYSEGGDFQDADIQKGARLAIIGASIAKTLFKDKPTLGRMITINKIPFQIIGILKAKGDNLEGKDQDAVVFVPPTTAKNLLWQDVAPRGVEIMYVQTTSRETLDDVADAIRAMLRKNRQLRDAQDDPFSVYNITAIKQVAADASKAFTVLLQAIASISLLVGSIGIMNIMLVTVTERTREIGIRKAIGATKSQILTQFLLEAMMLSFIGSVSGLVLGGAGGFAAYYLAGTPIEFSAMSVILSLAMAAGIGVVSGLYPAWKASRMQPIEALRTIGG